MRGMGDREREEETASPHEKSDEEEHSHRACGKREPLRGGDRLSNDGAGSAEACEPAKPGGWVSGSIALIFCAIPLYPLSNMSAAARPQWEEAEGGAEEEATGLCSLPAKPRPLRLSRLA